MNIGDRVLITGVAAKSSDYYGEAGRVVGEWGDAFFIIHLEERNEEVPYPVHHTSLQPIDKDQEVPAIQFAYLLRLNNYIVGCYQTEEGVQERADIEQMGDRAKIDKIKIIQR